MSVLTSPARRRVMGGGRLGHRAPRTRRRPRRGSGPGRAAHSSGPGGRRCERTPAGRPRRGRSPGEAVGEVEVGPARCLGYPVGHQPVHGADRRSGPHLVARQPARSGTTLFGRDEAALRRAQEQRVEEDGSRVRGTGRCRRCRPGWRGPGRPGRGAGPAWPPARPRRRPPRRSCRTALPVGVRGR